MARANFEKIEQVAATVMKRRGVEFSPADSWLFYPHCHRVVPGGKFRVAGDMKELTLPAGGHSEVLQPGAGKRWINPRASWP